MNLTPELLRSLPESDRRELVKILMEKQRRMASRNINVFCETVLKDQQGERILQASIHRQWHAHVEYCRSADKFPLIIAPWGHGKTAQLVIGKVLFELGQNRNQRIGVVCNSDGNARKRVAAIQQYVESDADYQDVFPQVRPDKKRGWEKHQFYIERDEQARSIDPSVFSAGVFSTGIGGRLDGLIFDDVVDRRNAIVQPSLRQQVIDAAKETWMSRLEPWGWMVYVATVWHEEDLTHHLVLDPEVRGGYLALVQVVRNDWRGIDCYLVGDVGDDYSVVGELAPDLDELNSRVKNGSSPDGVSEGIEVWDEGISLAGAGDE
jgi:hypothetical protein